MAQVNLGHVVGPGVPTGGTEDQVLVKNGATNFDTSWKDAGLIPSIANLRDGLAIVANGNTHAAIASGQFVYVKNHGTLAEGLYKAMAAIGTNATLSTSNLTADGAGGLNDLKGQIDSLNSKINSFLEWTNESYTNTDTTNGFVDTGISTSDYFILGAFTPNVANSVVRISNLTGSSPNYRVQIVSPINGTVDKSNWSLRIAFCLVARSKLS